MRRNNKVSTIKKLYEKGWSVEKIYLHLKDTEYRTTKTFISDTIKKIKNGS